MFYKSCITLMCFLVACHSASALDPCDDEIAQKFLNKPHLQPSPLAYSSEKTFWRVVMTPFNNESASSKLVYGVYSNRSCVFDSYLYDTDCNLVNHLQRTQSEVCVDEAAGSYYVISSVGTARYSFLCGKHATADYRCQVEGTGNGPKYRVVAPIEIDATEIENDIEQCIKELTDIDSTATFDTQEYPCC